MFKNTLAYILTYASLIYVIIQASHCGQKIVSSLMVFMGMYEMIFAVAKSYLVFNPLAHLFFLSLPDIIMIATSALAITYGGLLRAIGIAGIVIFAVPSQNYFHRKVDDGEFIYLVGPITAKYMFLYPVILAIYVTVLVKDQDQWIPRPQTTLEYVLLIGRTISGMGILDILGAILNAIYRDRLGQDGIINNSSSDLKTRIFWWGVAIKDSPLKPKPNVCNVDNTDTTNITQGITNPSPTIAIAIEGPDDEIKQDDSPPPPTL
ncbi:hypothetical protein BGZ76_001623 [Entomortierella beljakovae]|nr:hypothetical protein BGZ76_001623 [Entomortierella beljakovae]